MGQVDWSRVRSRKRTSKKADRLGWSRFGASPSALGPNYYHRRPEEAEHFFSLGFVRCAHIDSDWESTLVRRASCPRLDGCLQPPQRDRHPKQIKLHAKLMTARPSILFNCMRLFVMTRGLLHEIARLQAANRVTRNSSKKHFAVYLDSHWPACVEIRGVSAKN